MNTVVKEAIEINKKAEFEVKIPNVEIGDVCELSDIWDGNGDGDEILSDNSHAFMITDTDMNGNGNLPIYLEYRFEIIEKREGILNSVIKITDIQLL